LVYEQWFRDTIFRDPALVTDACRAARLTNEIWRGWATEFAVSNADGDTIGSIDVLLISSSGRVGIVETKLATIRRSAAG
jgi:hypothetical protein